MAKPWGPRGGYRAVIRMDKPGPKRRGRRQQYKPVTTADVFFTPGQAMRWVRRQIRELPEIHPDNDFCAARGWGNARDEFFAAVDSLWGWGSYSLAFLTGWGSFHLEVYQVTVLPIRNRACKCPEDEKEEFEPVWDTIRILRRLSMEEDES